MSVTALAFTIVGSKVDRGDFFVQEERSAHESCQEVGPGPFCQSCGKSIHEVVVTSQPLAGFEPEGGSDYQGRIGGLDIKPVRNGETSHFLAVVVCEAREAWIDKDGPQKAPDFDLAKAREKVRSVLDPLGLWDPEKFGIWTALYYS